MSVSRGSAALINIFDRVYSERRQKQLDRLVVDASVVGFIAHLVLVFLSRTLVSPPSIIAAVGKNYLSAIYTPFSFILFYEVLMLIGALPESTTQSIARQYEIVSLIFIRTFFKEIAELHGLDELTTFSREAWPVLLNVCAGLAMFLLVTVFLHAARRRNEEHRPESELEALEKFIARKKAIALGLTVLLLGIAVQRVIEFVVAPARVTLNAFFYTDVFTVMIFTDVLIVILSLAVSDRYELVFRNGAFVISTILIRFSLTAAWPYGATLALLGMIFGIGTLLIYNYHLEATGVRWVKSQRRETMILS
ncbi:MAG TPA: hypothetical protein VFW44_08040 [Bryobacteraceae bacterium]|nr:hypothetical protein [Bryobacteraceae bacterium]